jgi:hypothetical protein
MTTNESLVNSVTFPVEEVFRNRSPLQTEKVSASVRKLLHGPVEACDNYNEEVAHQPGYHALIAAAHLAYSGHYPLVLTPDAIWLTITQGLANHVNNNAEQLRHRFVPHQGTEVITVRRDDFVRGSPENPWAEVWPAFSELIKTFIGNDNHTLIVSVR